MPDKVSWTSRADGACYCDGPLGAVLNGEQVARILILQDPPQGYNPFSRKEFFPPTDRLASNVCGDADGCSVDRCSDLTKEELIERSARRAATANARAAARQKTSITRLPGGAVIATVGVLREVRAASQPNQQAIFVYDDPLADNGEHAVIRASVEVPEEEVALLLLDVRRTFSDRVEPALPD